MKRGFTLSLFVASLLFGSTTVMAASYHDSVSAKEAKALNSLHVKGEKTAQKMVTKTMSQEQYLSKVKSGDFQKEASIEETQRLHNTVTDIMQKHKATLKKAPKEFMNGLNDTIMALHSLKNNQTKEAKKLLTEADKNFKIAFQKEPKLGLIPVADNVEVVSFNAPVDVITQIKEAAQKRLEDDDTQTAIDMLTPLQDEIRIITQYVPTYLYPDAIKKASKELNTNKDQKALKTLLTVLDATQVETIIIPIPLVTAQDMVLQASKLEKIHKKEALKLLNAAKKELQKAKVLGYTHQFEKEYKSLNTQINNLKSEINGKNIVKKLYDHLLQSFHLLSNKQSSPKK